MPAALADGRVKILVGSEQELEALVAMFAPSRPDAAVEGDVAVEAA
jgi:hypothetical protein